jgi:hypothetical protein
MCYNPRLSFNSLELLFTFSIHEREGGYYSKRRGEGKPSEGATPRHPRGRFGALARAKTIALKFKRDARRHNTRFLYNSF